MTVEEAKALMTPTAISHLKDMVSENIIIDTSKKSACDIIMAAMCKAVETDVIHKTSLNQQFVNVLNQIEWYHITTIQSNEETCNTIHFHIR